MQNLIVERKDEICLIRFNNPKERNPLSIAVQVALDKILSEQIPISKAIIFTGTENVFASGANLREIVSLKTEQEAREFGLRGQKLMQKIADAPCLTVAAINGFCFGGALDLALACKIRIAAPNSVLSHPGAELGIMTGWGGTQRLPQLVGEAAALEMFITAKKVSVDEALRLNLISQISETVLETAVEICQRAR